jgi:hypothetical protein
MPIQLTTPIVVSETFDQLAAEGILIRFDVSNGQAAATIDYIATNANGKRGPGITESVDDLFKLAASEPLLAQAVGAVLAAVARLGELRGVGAKLAEQL